MLIVIFRISLLLIIIFLKEKMFTILEIPVFLLDVKHILMFNMLIYKLLHQLLVIFRISYK